MFPSAWMGAARSCGGEVISRSPAKTKTTMKTTITGSQTLGDMDFLRVSEVGKRLDGDPIIIMKRCASKQSAAPFPCEFEA